MDKIKEVASIGVIMGINRKRILKGGRPREKNPEYYKKALTVLEAQGFITQRELLKIFETNKSLMVKTYFENQGNGLYDIQVPITKEERKKVHSHKKETTIIYKQKNAIFNQWREENRNNGKYK